MQNTPSPKIFISYSRQDLLHVKFVVEMLKVAGATVWIDVNQVQYGERWRDAIQEAIAGCDRFILR